MLRPWLITVLLSALALALSSASPAHAQRWSNDGAARLAVEWLRLHHQRDGFGDADTMIAALHALGDAGIDPRGWTDGWGVSLLETLAPHAAAFARRDAASAGRLVAALAAAEQDPRAFGGFNPLALLQTHYDPRRGVYGGAYATPGDQAWALLALAAAREEAPATVVGKLQAWQQEDGGWAGAGGTSDVETTAVVASALVRSGVSRGQLPLGLATSFLSRAQLGSGGFTRAPGCGCLADARSTARAIQAILLIDGDPLSSGWNRPAGTPADWLRVRQDATGGMPWFGFGAADTASTTLAVSALLGRSLGAPAVAPALRSGVAWLRARGTPDGGFAPDGAAGDVDFTLEVVYALAAAGAIESDPRLAPSLGFLATHAPRDTALDLGRLIVAVVALGGDPYHLAGEDLLLRLRSFYNPANGSYGRRALDQAWALLALAAVHQTPAPAAVARLVDAQTADGGWRPAPEALVDTSTTALAVQALVAVGGPRETLAAARGYLQARQQPDGGFASSLAAVSATRATALATQALLALGDDPDGPGWARHLTTGGSALTANTPWRALLAWQLEVGGFPMQPGFAEADPLATAQSLAALVGRRQPVAYQMVRMFLPVVSHQYP